MDATLRGGLALYELLLAQQQHCHADTSRTVEALAELREDYAAHQAAPDGTAFVERVPGPPGCIMVMNADHGVIYFGAAEEYRERA